MFYNAKGNLVIQRLGELDTLAWINPDEIDYNARILCSIFKHGGKFWHFYHDFTNPYGFTEVECEEVEQVGITEKRWVRKTNETVRMLQLSRR